MDSMQAFMKSMEAQESGAVGRVFDWDKAAKLIKTRNPQQASAGLRDDWEWTGGRIFEGGKPVPASETCTFLASSWAIPELDLDGDIMECWVSADQKPEWNSGTYWPESALKILND